MKRRFTTAWWMAVAIVTLGGALSASALINLKYTPADLVKQAEKIVVLTVSAPVEDAMEAKPVAVLKGEALKEKTLSLDYMDASVALARSIPPLFGGRKTVTGVLFSGKFDTEGGEGGRSVMVLQIGTKWFVAKDEGDYWALESDALDLSAVWAGSAEMLVKAVQYAQQEAAAAFPVACTMRWETEQQPGEIKGAASQCLLVKLEQDAAPSLVVAAAEGVRIFERDKEGAYTDRTAARKLSAGLRCLAPGDFNGDGRLDLAGWDGKAVQLLARQADGTFVTAAGTAALDACVNLQAVTLGGTPALVAGTPQGPAVLKGDGKGGLAAPAPLPAVEGLGEGGICVAADFTGDGAADLVACFSDGMAFFEGTGDGTFKPAVQTAMRLVKSPSSVLCGDYDADGALELIVGGKDSFTMASYTAERTFVERLQATGELDYHGTMNEPAVSALAAADINRDGRQGVMVFYEAIGVKGYFNRGFAVFGFARQGLDLNAVPLAGAKAINRGQQCGAAGDLNEDGVPDLAAVDRAGKVWLLYGAAEKNQPVMTLNLAPGTPAPLTVAVSAGGRRTGTYVLRPGMAEGVGVERKGAVTLEWTGADGKPRQQRQMILKSKTVTVGAD